MMVIITFIDSYNLFAFISNSITVVCMIIIKLQVIQSLFRDILMLRSFYGGRHDLVPSASSSALFNHELNISLCLNL